MWLPIYFASYFNNIYIYIDIYIDIKSTRTKTKTKKWLILDFVKNYILSKSSMNIVYQLNKKK